ncbi:MAG: glutamyl-tRNA reductase [Gammaproteobacteria bacterium]|nr:glutamyl-tRNA reductase [Gammaproteobacteria bacterium]
MSLCTIGINHTTAPVSIREQVVFQPERLDTALRELRQVDGVDEAAILSTCNRTELYCHLRHVQPNEDIIGWLSTYHHVDQGAIRPFLYHHLDRSAVRHALRVACGLDSMVLGESQILGQLKGAYQDANRAGTLGRQLGRLFQHAFAVAKRVRTDTAIGTTPVSVAFAAVTLAKQIFGDLKTQTVLLIGAGQTIELVARHLVGSGIGRIIVANRHVQRAQALAVHFNGEGIGLSEIAEALPAADIVVSSTASPLPILGKGMVESTLKQRKHRPMFMVDLAVPRDIEPEVGSLEDIYLYTVDDLAQVIEQNMSSRQAAAAQADQIIDVQVETFMGWLRAQDAVGAIRAYRDRAELRRTATLARARRMLMQGRSPDEALQYLAHALSNQLTHDATHALNKAGREGRYDLLEAARILLQLPDDDG